MTTKTGEKRGVLEYQLYKINNVSTTLHVGLCGPLEGHPNSNVVMKNQREIELTNLQSEIMYQSKPSLQLYYTLRDTIPDCPEYQIQLVYKCLESVSQPMIIAVDYDTDDPFFCSNIMFVDVY